MSRLVNSTVTVEIETDTGYQSCEAFVMAPPDGGVAYPAEPLLSAIDEIVRILTLNGQGDEAVRKATQARDRVLAIRSPQ